jgi:hypothetical protein
MIPWPPTGRTTTARKCASAGVSSAKSTCGGRQRERSNEADAYANEREQRAATHDKADDAERLRTERESDRKLAPSLHD